MHGTDTDKLSSRYIVLFTAEIDTWSSSSHCEQHLNKYTMARIVHQKKKNYNKTTLQYKERKYCVLRSTHIIFKATLPPHPDKHGQAPPRDHKVGMGFMCKTLLGL